MKAGERQTPLGLRAGSLGGPRPGWLAAATVAAASICALVLLVGLVFQVRFEPTDDLEYRAAQGRLLILSTTPLLVLAVAALTLRRLRSRPRVRWLLLAVALVAAVVPSMTSIVVFERLQPGDSQQFSSFDPPPGVQRSSGHSDVSAGREVVTRHWTIKGELSEVCKQSIEAVRAWVSPGTLIVESQDGSGCSMRAEREGANVKAYIDGPDEYVPLPQLTISIERRTAGSN